MPSRAPASSNTNGVQGFACTYDVNIDTEQPTLTFLVNGNPPTNAYSSGTPVVTVIGSEAGGILSGLKQISCSVNGGTPFNLSGIGPDSNYTGSFELDQNGADQVSCTRHDGRRRDIAGQTPSNLIANVDNLNYAPNASNLIDNGHNPYTDGPRRNRSGTGRRSRSRSRPTTPEARLRSPPSHARDALLGATGRSASSTPIPKGGEQITITVPTLRW